MIVDGQDLGAAMTPSDILIELRIFLQVDDEDILEAMSAGADRVEADLDNPDGKLRLLSRDERVSAVAEARELTRSRLTAWRKRHREMTWPEMRILLIGLRETGS